jgi:hypothetical protein
MCHKPQKQGGYSKLVVRSPAYFLLNLPAETSLAKGKELMLQSMSFFRKIFPAKKEKPIKSYQDFWLWFAQNEKAFRKAMTTKHRVQETFLHPVSDRACQWREGMFMAAGFTANGDIELTFSAEGRVVNIPFVYEFVKTAPVLRGWKFTALQQPTGAADISISLEGFQFHKDNISFCPVVHPHMPDEIEIVVVHADYTAENRDTIANGTYIFLDNCIGEFRLATQVDSVSVASAADVPGDLIPIEKLSDYLDWRQAEFVEKYQTITYDTTNDHYTLLEGETSKGMPAIASVNETLLRWDAKPSHPWILAIHLEYAPHEQGMPAAETIQILTRLEEEIERYLPNWDGHLHVARQTFDGCRTIHFACRHFQKPALVLQDIAERNKQQMTIKWEVFKDKYWQSLSSFLPQEPN